MCEIRKKTPRVNAITVIDSTNTPVASMTGHIVIRLDPELDIDYDDKNGIAYIGISRTWLEAEVQRILSEQGVNIRL